MEWMQGEVFLKGIVKEPGVLTDAPLFIVLPLARKGQRFWLFVNEHNPVGYRICT